MRATLLAGLLPAAILCGLPGCRLIDQRTFEAPSQAQSRAQLSAARSGLAVFAPPLVAIRFLRLEPDWQARVLDAIHAAQARKPDIAFDVITPIPLAADAAAQQEAARQGASDAQLVANVLLGDGVDVSRVHLGVRGDAGDPGREVRIFVR